MKKISYLPILDCRDIPIFNPLTIYGDKRDIKSLSNNSIIRSLKGKLKETVTASLLFPKKAILKLHDDVINGPIMKCSVNHIIDLYNKIIEVCDFDNTLFVAVLRSGFSLAVLLRYIIYKIHDVEVEIIGITPNYIDYIYRDKLKRFISNENKLILFIDGWCSAGITYNIVKDMWDDLFPRQKFYYVVVTNPLAIKDNELLYETTEDILLPWSICQTDNIGLSNYFLNPSTNLSTAFYLPKKLRKIKNIEEIYRKFIDKTLINQDKEYRNDEENYFFNDQIVSRKYILDTKSRNDIKKGIIKVGINECVKSLDKNDASEIIIDEKIDKLYEDFLKKYAQIYGVKIKFVDDLRLGKVRTLVIRKND